eukprot:CAMPEP_0114556428 /NCGR_PEP_ID=MMETSP0114-20121206/9286_1 /TAXON_ID=31324 /ORGANISM="Goniomonas sp, Strain m" /LENGTH=139 /DNA_ID=CAMNT_0001741637 /DNA_START=347 /DNA_END=766 /DNA_ORIENTATION=+
MPPAPAHIERQIATEKARLAELVEIRLEELCKLRHLSVASFALVENITEDEVRDQLLRASDLATLQKLKEQKAMLMVDSHLNLDCRPTKKKEVCLVPRCRTVGFKQQCKGCHELFCLSHRLPEVHKCSALPQKKSASKK